MNKRLRLLFCLLILGVAFASAPMGAAQQNLPRVGGFKATKTDDPNVVAAAKFAVQEIGKKEEMNVTLLSVETAEYAVVAGMIYRLCLDVEIEGEEENVNTSFKVEVTRSLQKQYQLRKSEQVDGCGGGGQ